MASITIVTLHAFLVGYGSTRAAPTWDEPGHLAAGIAHHTTGRMDLYRVNPPLVRFVAGIPSTFTSASQALPTQEYPGHTRPEFPLAVGYIKTRGGEFMRDLTTARWFCLPFSIVGAITCYRFALELYGGLASVLAVCLWCFSPNVLGHAQLITPDVPAAAIGLIAFYFFNLWLKNANWINLLGSGILLGLAIGTKFTLLFFLILFPIFWIIQTGHAIISAFRLRGHGTGATGRNKIQRFLSEGAQLICILGLGLLVLNGLYGFEGTFQRLDSYLFRSAALSGNPSGRGFIEAGNRFSSTTLGRLRVPLPHHAVLGIDEQKVEFELGKPSYLFGRWQHGGWWHYYAIAVGLKVPLGTLLLLVAALCTFATRCLNAVEWRLFCIAISLFVMVSCQDGFSDHLRYLLPAFPFAFVLSTRFAASSAPQWARVVAIFCLAMTIIASSCAYPHSLSFFNTLAGGASGGPKCILGSNASWGQGILDLIRWQKCHEDRVPLYAALHASYDPTDLGLAYQVPKEGVSIEGELTHRNLPSGWYAIDVNYLYGSAHPIPCGDETFGTANPGFWTQFQTLVPESIIGNSIYLYFVPDRQEDDE